MRRNKKGWGLELLVEHQCNIMRGQPDRPNRQSGSDCEDLMQYGVYMFSTDYSMRPDDLAREVE